MKSDFDRIHEVEAYCVNGLLLIVTIFWPRLWLLALWSSVRCYCGLWQTVRRKCADAKLIVSTEVQTRSVFGVNGLRWDARTHGRIMVAASGGLSIVDRRLVRRCPSISDAGCAGPTCYGHCANPSPRAAGGAATDCRRPSLVSTL